MNLNSDCKVMRVNLCFIVLITMNICLICFVTGKLKIGKVGKRTLDSTHQLNDRNGDITTRPIKGKTTLQMETTALKTTALKTTPIGQLLKELNNRVKKLESAVELSDWKKLEFGCFHWGLIEMDWYTARTYCERRGGFLAEIRSHSEISAVKDILPNVTDPAKYWLGASDEDSEGDWKWVRTGESVEQPDGFGKPYVAPWGHSSRINGPYENCLFMSGDRKYNVGYSAWQDHYCKQKDVRPLCQKKQCPVYL